MVHQHISRGLPETPYDAIARTASQAAPRRLMLLLAAAVAVLAVAANAASRWPLAALAVGSAAAAAGSAALWGVAAHVAARYRSRPLVLLEWLLTGAGTAFAAGAAVALLLALLGQPWVL